MCVCLIITKYLSCLLIFYHLFDKFFCLYMQYQFQTIIVRNFVYIIWNKVSKLPLHIIFIGPKINHQDYNIPIHFYVTIILYHFDFARSVFFQFISLTFSVTIILFGIKKKKNVNLYKYVYRYQNNNIILSLTVNLKVVTETIN